MEPREGEPASDGRILVSRRWLLGASAALGASSLVTLHGAPVSGAPAAPAAPPFVRPSYVGTLRRRNDMLALRVIGYGLRIASGRQRGPYLVRARRSGPLYLALEFPSQHVQEEGIEDTDGYDVPKQVGTIDARLARPTRLAFTIDDDDLPLPLTISSLLDWNRWQPSLTPLPVGPVNQSLQDPSREPDPWQTAIEAPWALVLSPEPSTIWLHREVPHVAVGRTTLWHTRLARAQRIRGEEGGLVRGAFARPVPGGTTPATMIPPFPSLTPSDRSDIVRSSAVRPIDFSTPRAIRAGELMLTPLGATLDLDGQWDPTETGTSLVSWIHRSAIGRDQYVRVVRRGFYVPWRHEAVVVEVSERRPADAGNPDDTAAYLFKQRFWVTRQRVVDYPAGVPGIDDDDGRPLMFTSVEVLTSRTPKLDQTNDADKAHVAEVGQQPFLFDLVGTDRAGRRIPFRSPLALAPADSSYGSGLQTALDLYNTSSWDGSSNASPFLDTGGRPIAYAPEGTAPAGSTSLPTERIRVRAMPVASPGTLQALGVAPFWPEMVDADVRFEAAAIASGNTAPTVRLKYPTEYVTGDFHGGEVFLHGADAQQGVDLTFARDGRGGGIVRPDLRLDGVSRTYGLVAGATDVAAGNPSAPAVQAMLSDVKLLGVVPLKNLIGTGGLGQIPALRTLVTAGTLEDPDRIETTMRWEPKLIDATSGLFEITADNAVLRVDSVWCRDLAENRSTSIVRGEIVDLGITAAHVIHLQLERVAFTSVDGGKTDVRIDIGKVTFLGILELLAKLTDSMPTPAAPRGSYVDVSSELVRTGLVVELPALQIGAFTLENVRFRSELDLALDGDDALFRFAFSSRDDPFHLIVLALGGGGSVQLEVAPDGIRALDVSLEAGAQIGIDLGVASGKVSAFVGVYIRFANTETMYEAYVKLTGSLRLLGLVTVTAKLMVSLTYHEATGKLSGTAKCCYSIDMGLWDKEVCVGVKRTIAGSGSDPFFDEEMTITEWTDYCAAFAA